MQAGHAAEVDRLAGRVVQLEAEVGRLQETQVSRNRLTNQRVAEAVGEATAAERSKWEAEVASAAADHKVRVCGSDMDGAGGGVWQ